MKPLTEEFGPRLVTLRDGSKGLRAGIRCEVKTLGGDEPVLEFVATDETLDRYDEVIKLDGWQLENFRANPVVVDTHDYSSVLKILGRAEEVSIVAGQMRNRVRFALDNPLGAVAYKMARAGFIRSQSVGFQPIEWVNGKNNTEPSRTFTKQELLEISLVAIPANPGATVGLALKSGVLDKSDVTELAEALRSFCGDVPQKRNSQERNPSQAGATGGAAHIAQLLPLARALADVAKRA